MKLKLGIQRHLQIRIAPHDRFFSIRQRENGMIGFDPPEPQEKGIETSVTSFRLHPIIQVPPKENGGTK
jgi:hypothetical protein